MPARKYFKRDLHLATILWSLSPIVKMLFVCLLSGEHKTLQTFFSTTKKKESTKLWRTWSREKNFLFYEFLIRYWRIQTLYQARGSNKHVVLLVRGNVDQIGDADGNILRNTRSKSGGNVHRGEDEMISLKGWLRVTGSEQARLMAVNRDQSKPIKNHM